MRVRDKDQEKWEMEIGKAPGKAGQGERRRAWARGARTKCNGQHEKDKGLEGHGERRGTTDIMGEEQGTRKGKG